MDEFDHLVGGEILEERFELITLCDRLDDRSLTIIDDPRAIGRDDRGEIRIPLRDFDQKELSFVTLVGSHLLDTNHIDEFEELGAHLIKGMAFKVQDNGHARDLGVLSRTYRERVDVVTATGEERSNACEHAGAIFDEDGECMDRHL